jgi:hypothetical protein
MACNKNASGKADHNLRVKNNCCSTKIIDTSIKTEYLAQQNNNNENIQFSVIILTANPFEKIEQLNSNKKYFQDFSPPLFSNNNLYLNNLVLLI